MTGTLSEYMSIAQLAEYSSLSRSTLRKWLAAGMPCFKLGRSIRVKRSDFDQWLEQFRAVGTATPSGRRDVLRQIMDEVRR